MNPAPRNQPSTISRVVLICLLMVGGLSAQAPPPEPLVLLGVTVVDPVTGSRTANQRIIIRGDRIESVGPGMQTPARARVLDARGKFAIPGLWDMHVHFMNAGVTALPLLLAHGVTSVREMGGYLDSTRAWQARMAAGTLSGPRIKTPGPILESPRYLAGVRMRDSAAGGLLAPRILPYRIGIPDSAAAERAIDSLKRLGVDFVKIRTSASRTALLGILGAAGRAGLKVAGHQPGALSLVEAVRAGQQDIEHAFFSPLDTLTGAQRSALYRELSAAGLWYTPTLVVSRAVQIPGDSGLRVLFGPDAERGTTEQRYASPWLLGWWRMQLEERTRDTSSANAAANRRAYASSLQDVRGLQDAGVAILAGTDAGSVLVYPGFSLHEELRLLVDEAKLTPAEALRAATITPARFFGIERDLGTVAAGKIADLLLLESDPLIDIRNSRRIFAVVQGGKLLDRAALDGLLAGAVRK
jgi:imidazolonepropionase-like amidohydrolase